MIALMLDASDTAALASALPPGLALEEDLHITLAYLGKAAQLTRQQSADIDGLLEALGAAYGPISGVVSGFGYFNQDEDGQRVLYASFDAPDLPDLRQTVAGALEAVGVPVDDTHGFTPHITLAYCPTTDQPHTPDVPTLKITFPAITRVLGGDRADFIFAGAPEETSEFIVSKSVDGRTHWVLISSNSFEDREREIISQKALEDDVARADADGNYGPLNWWHLNGQPDKTSGEPTPVTVLGHCTGNAMHGRMLVEWGDFIDERVGQAVKEVAPQLAVSLDFSYPPDALDAQGVFHQIRRTGRALVPRRLAANPLTASPIIVQEDKFMVKEKVAALRAVLGGDDELVNKVLVLAAEKEAGALEAGVRHKETVAVGEFTAADGVAVNAVADMSQKATITIDDGDKPKGDDDKPKEDPPKAEQAAPPAAEAKPVEGDTPPPADGAAPPVGDVPPAPAAATIGAYTEQQLAEYVAKVIDAKLSETQGAQAAAKEARDGELLARQKEQGETLNHILKQVGELSTATAAALAGVSELKGEQTRYVASKQGREVSEEAAKLITKDFLGPQSDPMHKHMVGFIQSAAPQVPGQ